MNEAEKFMLFQELIEEYGAKHQSMVCIEEMSELTKELVKFERGENNHDQIAEETADVLIMLEQIIKIYGIADKVESWKNEKLKRTKARLQLKRMSQKRSHM